MKEKILIALKTKYKTLGFSDKAFDGVADYLSKTVTDEANIETAISGVDGLLKAFQGESDFLRNEKSGLQKELDELKKKVTPQPEPKPADDMATIIANAVAAAVKPLSDKLEQYEGERKANTWMQQVLGKAKEYGVPESQAKRYSIPEGTDLDTYFREAKQELTNLGYKETKAPESADQQIKSNNEEIAGLISKGTEELTKK